MTFFKEDAAMVLEFSERCWIILGAIDEIINAMLAVMNIYEIHEGTSLSEGRNMIQIATGQAEARVYKGGRRISPGGKVGDYRPGELGIFLI